MRNLIKPDTIASYIPFRFFIVCWLCGLLSPALAQVQFSASASTKDMGKTDYVQVQFVVENAKQIDNFQVPDFPDFTIVQGPSESTGMNIVNGAMSQSKGIVYLLQPKKTGRLTIKSATATVDGKPMHTDPILILVHNSGGSGNTQPPGFGPLPDPDWPAAQPVVDMDEVVKPGENVADKIRKNFFIKVDVSKTECYLGEIIVATYKLYARLRSDSRVTRHPSLNGFSVYDMIDPSDDKVSVEKMNGKNYSVHIIRKTQLIPLQPGEITLDPVELDNNIYFIRADGNANNARTGLGGLFDRLFSQEERGTPFTQHVVLESKPVIIHVKPLPEEGRPADFNGAVGKYSITASIDSKEVDTADAAVLSVTVKGSGNLPVINAPVVNWPANMESYDVNSKENIDKTISPLSGSKIFNYSFTCSKPGKYELPPIKLSYFDPAAKSYKTTESDPLHIQINSSKKKKHEPPVIIPEKTNTDWTNYALWTAAFLLLAAATVFIFRQSKKDALAKTEKAKAMAAREKLKEVPVVIDPLQESRALMESGDYSRFFASVNRAIWKAVSEKLGLPASELNKLSIASGLRSKGWREEHIVQLTNLLSECEMKLYTPEFTSGDVHRVLQTADDIFLKLLQA